MRFLTTLYKFTLPLFLVAWAGAWVVVPMARMAEGGTEVIAGFSWVLWLLAGICGFLTIASLVSAWQKTPAAQIQWRNVAFWAGMVVIMAFTTPALHFALVHETIFNVWTQGAIFLGSALACAIVFSAPLADDSDGQAGA